MLRSTGYRRRSERPAPTEKRKLKEGREIRKAYKKILKEHACEDFLRVKI